MAKKKKAQAAPQRAIIQPPKKGVWRTDRDSAIDSAFSAMCDGAQTRLGRTDICVGGNAAMLVVGIPLPALALRILYQSTVHPLGRIFQIVGPQGSCKSAALYELYRWHAIYGGGHAHVEVENKDSPVLRESVLDYNEHWIKRSLYLPADYLEEWQKAVTYGLGYFCDLMDRPGGPGRTLPVAVGVDSLTAAAPLEEQQAVMDTGFATRGYALMANLITRYMRCMATRNRTYPITIAGVNHQKSATSPMGQPTKVIPGGVQVDFQATHILEMCRAHTGADINFADREGLRVNLKMLKNSQGASRQQIVAEFVWWWDTDPVTGEARQRHRWDWETASIEALLRIEEARKADFNRIMKIVDLHAKKSYPRTVWSKALGISEASPLSWHEAGVVLESRTDILEALYPELGIAKGYHFEPGVEYAAMLDAMKKDGAKESKLLYENAVKDMSTRVTAASPAAAGKPAKGRKSFAAQIQAQARGK